MASTSATVDECEVEELEERMKAISDMLKTKVSNEDRILFEFLLCELQQRKAALQNKNLGSLLAKYGNASSALFSEPTSAATQSQVITVDSQSPQPCNSGQM